MVLVQKWPFFQPVFLGNIGQENVFYDIPEQKDAFLGYNKIRSQSREIDIFPNGLTHGFGRKMVIFQTFFFWKYMPEKCLLRYSKVEKRLSRI